MDLALKITATEKDKAGDLKITASGLLEDKAVGFALVVPSHWSVHPLSRPEKVMRQFFLTLVRDGEASETLDVTLRKLFKLKESETVFKPSGYSAMTLATREQLEHSKVEIGLSDPRVEGESDWQFAIKLDLPNKTMQLNLRDIRF